MDKFREIRAYHTAGLVYVTDFLFVLPFLHHLVRTKTKGVTLDYLQLPGMTAKESRKAIEKDIRHGAFYMTNHRDIVLDAAFLGLKIIPRYCQHPYIGIGNNLFAKWWIEPLCRHLRTFVVKRNGTPRELMQSSLLMSEYIQHIRQKRHKTIWMAQREGRAKDSNDRTQPSVLKMLTLSAENNSEILDQIKVLNICPVSLNYEYDPCDYLKAAEMQLKRDNPHWRKSKRDDVISMKTGIFGYKGRVVFRMTPSINHWIDANRQELESLTKNEMLQKIAQQIDQQIFLGYEIYERGTEFDAYIDSRIALIDIPNKDEAFLREKLLEMYSFPVKNHAEAVERMKGASEHSDKCLEK